ncbi:MAG: DUF6316 family protein [Pseudomonadales bacterium]
MNLNRAGEQGRIPVRTDRYFTVDRDWYFSTREGCPVGPYPNKNQAGKSLNDFLEFLSLAKPRMLSAFYSSLAKNSAY